MKIQMIFPTVLKWTVGLCIGLSLFTLLIIYENASNDVIELSEQIYDSMISACELISIESYRETEMAGITYNLLDKNGAVAISGSLYNGSEDASYRMLYAYGGSHNHYAKEWVDWFKSKMEANGESIEDNAGFQIFSHVVNGTAEEGMINQHITPNNLGYTYLDKELLEHAFKWTLANNLTADASDTVKGRAYNKRERLLNNYIRWRGFRIYYDTIDIDIDYDNEDRVRLFDLTNTADAQEFYDRTGIEARGTEGQGVGGYLNDNSAGTDLRKYVVMYTVKFKVDIGYEGLLPFKQIMDTFFRLAVNNQRLAGYNLNGEQRINEDYPDFKSHKPTNSMWDTKQNGNDLIAMGTYKNNNSVIERTIGRWGDPEMREEGSDQTIGLYEEINYYIIH